MLPVGSAQFAALGVARIPWDKWVRFIWKFILALVILGGILMIPKMTIVLAGF